MNSKELFEEYTKEASNKMKWVSNKAKELGVSGSDVVFELLKSGFRLDELKRGNPTQYKSAQKKLDAWKKAGSPSDEDEDVLQRIKEENTESTQVEEKAETAEVVSDVDDILYPAEYVEKVESEISKLTEEINKLNEALERKEKYIIELEGEKDGLEDLNGKQAEHLVEVMSENTRLRERIRGLEDEAEEVKTDNCKDELINALRLDKEQLLNTNKELIKEADKLRADLNHYRSGALEELTETIKLRDHEMAGLQAELNEARKDYSEALMINRKLEEQLKIESGDLKSEQQYLTECQKQIDEVAKQLRKAERFILNKLVYSRIDEEE